MFVVGTITSSALSAMRQRLLTVASAVVAVAFMALGGTGTAAAAQKPDGPPYSIEYINAYLLQPEAFPSTGTITASAIGNGVWWRPELNETSVTAMLHNLNEWGINNVYVDVFRSGHTLFPSQVLPQNDHAADRDWLEFIITEAHNHNIRVHAWAQMLCWHEADAGAATTHPLLLANPHWQQVTSDGQVLDGATASRYVSPASPEVREVLLTMTEELCRYPIDGLNLDAMHYNYRLDAGYASDSVEEFETLHGVNPVDLPRKTGRESDWMKWVSYREDKVTSLVQLLSEKCRLAGERNRRRILVSVNVHPDYEEARGTNRRFQHWGQWVEEGLVDATIPQCFNPDLPGLERQLWEARSIHMGSKVACLPGLLLGVDSTGNRPTLKEQRRLLVNTGFQYCTVMDYHSLLQEKTSPKEEQEDESHGFWDFFKNDNGRE